MTYRDEALSLRAYRDRLVGELEDARRAAHEARERAETVTRLEKDLAAVNANLAASEKSRRAGSGPILEDVRIAAPCGESWERMQGDDRVRFCGTCEKNVYNLSAMPRAEAEALLAERGGDLCVRLYKRADGTVLTEDCPVGLKRRRRVRLAIAAVGGGMVAAASAAFLPAQRAYEGPALMGAMPPSAPVTTTMGSSAAPLDDPPAPSTRVDPPRPLMGAPKAFPRMGQSVLAPRGGSPKSAP